MSGPHSWLATSEPGGRSQKTAFWTTCSATHHSPNLPFPPILMHTKLTLENNKGKGSIQEIGFMECRHLDKQKRAEREFRQGRGTVCVDYPGKDAVCLPSTPVGGGADCLLFFPHQNAPWKLECSSCRALSQGCALCCHQKADSQDLNIQLWGWAGWEWEMIFPYMEIGKYNQ